MRGGWRDRVDLFTSIIIAYSVFYTLLVYVKSVNLDSKEHYTLNIINSTSKSP